MDFENDSCTGSDIFIENVILINTDTSKLFFLTLFQYKFKLSLSETHQI